MSLAQIDKNASVESITSINQLKEQSKAQRSSITRDKIYSPSSSEPFNANLKDPDTAKSIIKDNFLITKTLGDYKLFVKNVLNRQQCGYFPLLGIERTYNKDAIDFLSRKNLSSNLTSIITAPSSTDTLNNPAIYDKLTNELIEDSYHKIDDAKIEHFIEVMTAGLRHRKVTPFRIKRIKLSTNEIKSPSNDLNTAERKKANFCALHLSQSNTDTDDDEVQKYTVVNDDISFLRNSLETKNESNIFLIASSSFEPDSARTSNNSQITMEMSTCKNFKSIDLTDNQLLNNINEKLDCTLADPSNAIQLNEIYSEIQNDDNQLTLDFFDEISNTIGSRISVDSIHFDRANPDTLMTPDEVISMRMINKNSENYSKIHLEHRKNLELDALISSQSNSNSISEVSNLVSNKSDVHPLIFIGFNEIIKQKTNATISEKYAGKSKLFNEQLYESLKKMESHENIENKCMETLVSVLISLKLLLSYESNNDEYTKVISNTIGLLNSIVNTARKKVTPLFFAICLFIQSVLYDKLYMEKMDQMKKCSKAIVDFFRHIKKNESDDYRLPSRLFSLMQSYVSHSRYSLHARQCYMEAVVVFDNFKSSSLLFK